MPIKEDQKMTVVMVGGGKTIRFDGLTEVPSLTLADTEQSDAEPVLQFNPQQEFSGTLKLRRLSRKRFVSNMRRLGLTKKQAKRLAWAIKVPYSVAWIRAVLNSAGNTEVQS